MTSTWVSLLTKSLCSYNFSVVNTGVFIFKLHNKSANFVLFIDHKFFTFHRSPNLCTWPAEQFRTIHSYMIPLPIMLFWSFNFSWKQNSLSFENLWMSSQPIVQWIYVIYFHPWGSFFSNLLHQCLEKGPSRKKERNCKSTRFVYVHRWLRDMTTHPLTKYYIIERLYFLYRLFILFISIFLFLLLLYTVSWRYKRD